MNVDSTILDKFISDFRDNPHTAVCTVSEFLLRYPEVDPYHMKMHAVLCRDGMIRPRTDEALP